MNHEICHWRTSRSTQSGKLWHLHAGVALAVAALAVSALACGRIGFAPTQSSAEDGRSATFSIAGATVNPNSRHTMIATGGVAPYQFSVRAGQASIDTLTGELHTPMFSQDIVVEARDASNQVATTTIVVDGTNLYYAAGRDDAQNAQGDIWRSGDAGLSWQLIGALPGVSYNGGFIVYQDAMLFIAGRPGNWRDEVWRSVDGIAWTQIGQLPETRASFYPAVFDGALWVVGGFNEAATRDQVWRSDDGGATWQRVGQMPLTIHGGALVPFQDRLWYFGGNNEGGTGYRDDAWSTTDGATWTEVPDLFVGACAYTSVHVDDNGLLQVGGSTTPCNDGVHRSIDAMAWQRVGSLPTPRSNGRMLRHRGEFIYAAGANSEIGDPGSPTVYASPDGVTWSTRGMLPAARFGGGMVAYTPR